MLHTIRASTLDVRLTANARALASRQSGSAIAVNGGPTGLTSVADFSAAAAAVWGLEPVPSPTAGMKISSTPGTAGTPTSGNVARVRPTNVAYHPRIHA
ncbi:hypothetical protein [Achromobacter xylosoxidans]|uniref:hypothetical protein n=1 Tax=Alcaligenes xylosoxydans xylosoxydans TaxID=85698 RepID=UPI0012BD58C9|nr:hypothetical protein [Achromobacter xylosoxidans]